MVGGTRCGRPDAPNLEVMGRGLGSNEVWPRRRRPGAGELQPRSPRAPPPPSFARASPASLSLLDAGGAVLTLTRGWDVDAAAVCGQARHGLCSGRRRRVHG
ncbi:hypothetical protein BDA96_02G097000 [Sorghum bicolor]|uniref:Uncharacterized protein n=1 Tax=Sorghum bicolor TaxID=4558 RepID=A0A921RMV9_SORBI|nr:hypothetical protein BDA96_02G097000 [Sorghum bicolor]